MEAIISFNKFKIQPIYGNLYQITCIDENNTCFDDYAELHNYLIRTFPTSAFTSISNSFIVNERVHNKITNI